MKEKLNCTLCETPTYFYKKDKSKNYYRCPNCDAILLHPNYYLPSIKEKAHYQTHNNDVEDIRYQNFVLPIIKQVINNYDKRHNGLDFGAGTGPVITKLLTDKGYNISLYDPFFWNDETALLNKYDFIILSEVIEHFHDAKKEFNLLNSLLNEKSSLIIRPSPNTIFIIPIIFWL